MNTALYFTFVVKMLNYYKLNELALSKLCSFLHKRMIKCIVMFADFCFKAGDYFYRVVILFYFGKETYPQI